ncbi:hypothetical protein AB832_07185 [Flavobacteriaceae bacterium (ex Bugula neritina AB1)]|nr:hypothetical protein AB832_07185 [Flavobacteriaceae bacterium (ex Bugula neritina AB1)]
MTRRNINYEQPFVIHLNGGATWYDGVTSVALKAGYIVKIGANNELEFPLAGDGGPIFFVDGRSFMRGENIIDSTYNIGDTIHYFSGHNGSMVLARITTDGSTTISKGDGLELGSNGLVTKKSSGIEIGTAQDDIPVSQTEAFITVLLK